VDRSRLVQIVVNAHWERLRFQLAEPEKGGWRRFVDTALPSPEDIRDWSEAPAVSGREYAVEGRSVVVLFSGPGFQEK
jgi:glycogen operon protein